jgi:F-type H+-transporting ATPase subunit b
MGLFYWLATPSIAEAEAHGLSLNTDIFEANLINLAIVIGIVVYFGRGFLGKILSERKSGIEATIQDSETKKKQAIQSQSEQEKVAQAATEAQRILAEAENGAKTAQEGILAQAILEIQRLEESATADTTSSQARAIAELRQRVVELSLKKVEQELQAQISGNEEIQRKLIDRSIDLLGVQS